MERFGALLESQVSFIASYPFLASVAIVTMTWGAIHQAELLIRFITWVIRHLKRELTELLDALLELKREVTFWNPEIREKRQRNLPPGSLEHPPKTSNGAQMREGRTMQGHGKKGSWVLSALRSTNGYPGRRHGRRSILPVVYGDD